MIRFRPILLLSCLIVCISACQKDDIKLEHTPAPSDASVNVVAKKYSMGAMLDTVSYIIKVKSEKELLAINLDPSVSGMKGSGFDISFDSIDPFIDHRFGTVHPGYKELEVKYDYIIPIATGTISLKFQGSDTEGTSVDTVTLDVVPAIRSYSNIDLYYKDNARTDGFATYDGFLARDLGNYALTGTENAYSADTILDVQEKIDMLFIMKPDIDTAIIACPADGNFSATTTAWRNGKNKTVFKKLNSFTASDFDNLTPASLVALTKNDSINKYGSTSVEGLKTGDLVGFITSFNSTNSYKLGVIKVNAIHPSSVSWYSLPNYAIEFDVKVQVSNGTDSKK